MPANFLHGIESIEKNIGAQPVTIVRSAVIGLVGTAPIWSGPTPADAVVRPQWSASVLYFVGTRIVDSNNNVQVVTTAGHSQTPTHPSWATTLGNTTGDGSDGLVWTNVGPFAGKTIPSGVVGTCPWPLWNRSAHYQVGDCVVDSNGNLQQCIAGETSSATTAPTWGTTLGSVSSGSSANWALIAFAKDLGYSNALRLVSGVGDTPFFGELVKTYTIPQALVDIQLQGAGQVIVINVFDQYQHRTHNTSRTNVSFPGAGAQTIKLGHMGVSNVTVTQHASPNAVYVLGVDFTLDQVNGVVTALSTGSISSGEAVDFDFYYADVSSMNNKDLIIIGTALADGTTVPPVGTFAGMQLLPLSMNTFGFNPKIVIVPEDSRSLDVEAAMQALCAKMKAIAYVATDLSGSATPSVQAALANRGLVTTAFGISDRRVMLCYPREQFIDNGVDPAGLPISNPAVHDWTARAAGARAAKDLASGYWTSGSNTVMIGSLGPDVHMTMSTSDASADNQQLNAAGIFTMFTGFGLGLRTFGNRSSAYPAATTPDVFECIRRTFDIIEESLEFFTLQFLDGPITNALIDAILQSANAFVRLQIQRGALVDGSTMTFDKSLNPPTELVNGHITFTLDGMAPPPAERITFQVNIDPSLLGNLG